MNQEIRFSGNRGLQGCLVAIAFMFVFSSLVSLVLNNWLGRISNETERVLIFVVYFLGICVGGYVAAPLGKTTGWTNSLVVGLLAEICVAGSLFQRTKPDATYFSPFMEMMNDPGGPLAGYRSVAPDHSRSDPGRRDLANDQRVPIEKYQRAVMVGQQDRTHREVEITMDGKG